MNKMGLQPADDHRTLQILNELAIDDTITQRDLSSRLGIALGLANSYLKNLIAKGYVTVRAIPRRRYAYFLTPKGFAEKSRLTFDLLQDYTRIYREARSNLKSLFAELQATGVKTVVFAGADEVAEIAYLTLQETGLQLKGVLDDELAGKNFFGITVGTVADVRDMQYDRIVVASYLKRGKIRQGLQEQMISPDAISVIFPE